MNVHPLFLFLVLWVEPFWEGYDANTDTTIYCYEWQGHDYQITVDTEAVLAWDNGDMPQVIVSDDSTFCESICH